MAICLKVTTDYTFLSSNIKIKDIINHAILNHLNACAIIDKNNIFGAYEFYNECIAHNLKPIIGIELTIDYHENIYPIILIAKSEKGYTNIMKLSSLINKYNTSSLSSSILSLYAEDVICILSSYDSYLSFLINQNKIFEANEYIENLKNIFKNIYLGIYRYKNANLDLINNIKEYCNANNIKSIAMQIANHKKNNDSSIVKILDCIKKNIFYQKDEKQDYALAEAYLKSNQELNIYYEKDELANLQNLISTINITIKKVKFNLPFIKDKNLKEITFQALKDFHLNDKEEYLARLEYELEVIYKMGFEQYFLVVADYVNYAKNNNILVGPARGSGSASLVAYLLKITTIDPLKYDLLFERFLNPHRQNYPDFDIDFSDIKRDEVINYCKEKYGYKKVAHIVTFSTLGPKSALRDVARVLKIPLDQLEHLLNYISKNCESLNKEYKENSTFKNLLDIHPQLKILVSIASQIEGLKRQASLHAAGMILSNDDLTLLVPTFEENEKSLVVAYDFLTCEKLGLIKMDFLGLKNLTIIDECLKKYNLTYNKNETIDTLNYDDSSTYKLISSGATIGIFQLESEGMKNVIKKLKPTCFDDIVALIALYRPGPMQNIDTYIKRKHKEEETTYLDERLIPILEKTYGIIVYQEQIMQIVQTLANFSFSEADIFRRAISKKKNDVLIEQKEHFINGCLANNVNQKKALEIFNHIVKFAEYGFNKGHSVGYSKITAIMAYLKAKTPGIFYETLLNINKDGNEKKKVLFEEAKLFNIKVVFPSINKSEKVYLYKENTLIIGLTNIASIKDNIADIIINERKKAKFSDWFDCIIRLVINNISQPVIADLIYAGALDEFNIPRSKLIANLNNIYNSASMFLMLDYLPNSYNDEKYSFINKPILIYDDNETDYIKKEYELLGLYISTHPLAIIKEKVKVIDINKVKEDGYFDILGKILNIELKKTKNNKDVVILKLEDDTTSIIVRNYNSPLKIKNDFKKGEIVLCNISLKQGYTYLNEIRKYEDVL